MRRADLLARAAALLDEDADVEQESCAIGDMQWTCPDCVRDAEGKCQAMRNVEDRRKVAAALRALV